MCTSDWLLGDRSPFMQTHLQNESGRGRSTGKDTPSALLHSLGQPCILITAFKCLGTFLDGRRFGSEIGQV